MAATFRSLRSIPLSRAAALPRPTAAQSSFAAGFRAFSSSLQRKDDHGPVPPQLYGPGGKAGKIASNEEQATGLERYELMADMLGYDAFDMKPLEMTRMGTIDDPIKIFSLAPERYVGCTGFPADSHDTIWMRVDLRLSRHRCPECGCAYTLDFKGDPHQLEHIDQEIKGPWGDYPYSVQTAPYHRTKEQILAEFGHKHEHHGVEGESGDAKVASGH